jgi:hypothetical protein
VPRENMEDKNVKEQQQFVLFSSRIFPMGENVYFLFYIVVNILHKYNFCFLLISFNITEQAFLKSSKLLIKIFFFFFGVTGV